MSNVRALIRGAVTEPDDVARVGGSTSGGIYFGTGTPEGNLEANPGSIFFRSDYAPNRSAEIYFKVTGTGKTGWFSDCDPPRWTDVLLDVAQVGGVASLTLDAYRDTGFNVSCFRYNQADELQGKVQMPHEWIPDTEVRVHMHCIPLADPATTQTAALSGSYVWAHYGAEVPAAASWTAFDATLDVPHGGNFKSSIMPLFSSTPTGSKESSILLFRVAMNTGATTYTTGKTGGTAAANLAVLYLDTHYQRNKWGTSEVTH